MQTITVVSLWMIRLYLPVATRLLQETKITMIGTINKNKRELTIKFNDTNTKNSMVESVYFFNSFTLTKMKKIVTLFFTITSFSMVINEKTENHKSCPIMQLWEVYTLIIKCVQL